MGQKLYRIALWSGPRDIATGLLYAFAQREDTTVSDEPLFGYYLGFTGIDIPFRDEVIARMEIDPAKIVDMLETCDLNSDYLFVKNKADQAVGIQWDFMRSFKNVFLISKPDHMIMANDIEKDEQELIDTCYEVQYHQVLYLIEAGLEPIVVDADDLVERPEEILPTLCAKLKIPFQRKMLNWQEGEKEFESLPSRNWCKHMHNSKDFETIKREQKILTPAQLELFEECLPFYEKLKRYAIS